MAQPQKSLEDWLAFLGAAELPVLRHTQRELERLHADEAQFNARTVAEVVTTDPLLTLKLLRYLQLHKHRKQEHELVDVKHVLLMMGLDAFLLKVPATPSVEEVLNGHIDALVSLLNTVRRAQRAAYWAYDWALRLHDLHAEEVFVSTLLAHVSEMLMWCFNPVPMLEILHRQRADPALRSVDAQKQVLGFTGMEFQRRLTVEWRLPELLQNLTDPALGRSSRVRNVMLAVNLARHSAHGWDDAALPDDYQAIGELLRMEPERVQRMVQAPPEAAASQ
ncbi:MAG: HDOD domain-containing protein [Gammaproteobacteria bacterium]|jgi:HD-like signal output (HDOD) protein